MTRTVAAGSFFLFFVLLCVLPNCSSQPQKAEMAPTPHVFVDGELLYCGSDMYVPAAMNLKIAAFPELVQVSGVAQVNDCPSATTFGAAYLQYAAKHPGFDAEQRIDLSVPDEIPPEPTGVQEDYQTQKILNGTPVGLSPVVRLFREGIKLPDGGARAPGGLCTGTFIAKNYIVTAAHCLAPTSPASWPGYFLDASMDVVNPASINEWADWQIAWFDSSGNVQMSNPSLDSGVNEGTAAVLEANVWQRPDPRWMGQTLGGPFPNDFAMIYVPVSYDNVLPPDPNAQGSTMLLSRSAPSSTDMPIAYGGGAPSNFTLNTLTFPTPFDENPSFWFTTTLPASYSGAELCHGDSGGPVVRMVGGQPAILGVLTNYLPQPTCGGPDSGFADPFCCSGGGSVVYWTRVDQEFDFIQNFMQKYYQPNFSCDVDTDALTADCSGKSCSADTDCQAPSTMSGVTATVGICRFLPSATAFCPVCNTGGGCGCVKGMCFVSTPSFGLPDGSPDE